MLGPLAILIAYLLGGIPFGFLLVKLTKGADVRDSGSGNIGATNVLRTTGRAAGVATLALDIAKGYIAVWLAAELTGRLVDDRRPLAGLALSTDSSALTCIGNDYGFDAIFERQVRALGRGGDGLVLISTSGNSANLLRAAQAARDCGVVTLGLLGRDGGKLAALCDDALIIPSAVTARIQEAHIFVGHCWCSQIEQALGLA